MKIRRVLLAAAAVLTMVMAVPDAGAITRGGELDGEEHPYVGLMVYFIDGVPQSRCTGSLISPEIYVTAGHCVPPVEGAETTVEIWFDSDVESGINFEDPLAGNGYPFVGDVGGTPYAHPLYDDNAFFLYDLAVVVLDEPYYLDEYASLPEAGLVDTLGNGRKNGTVTAVGYGLQQIISNPQKGAIKLQADRVRYQADLMIVNTQGVAGIGNIDVPLGTNSMLVSGDAKHGGTCFGDSGGPMLVGNTIVAVNSFGLNGNCAGVGGVFRIDRQVELDFINSFLD